MTEDGRVRPSERTFRWLLLLGAATSVAIGLWGLAWSSMLETVLGLTDPAAAARVYGGVMVSVGVGYVLAAVRPQQNRGLLVLLLLVPLLTAVSVIAGVARGEIETAQGAGFAVYSLAYCLLYVRLYPKVPESDAPSEPFDSGEPSGGEPPGPAT